MYESPTTTTTSALHNSNAAIFTDDTISRILALSTKDNSTVNFQTSSPDANGTVTVAAGAEVVFVQSSNATPTTITPPKAAPVVIFQAKGGINATFNDGQTFTDTTVDRVVIGSSGNDNLVVADAKNSQITLGTGNSTVLTGHGADTVVAGLGNSTVVGGTAHSIVQLKGNASDYTVSVQNGHAIVTSTATGKYTDISKLQYVQLDNHDALIFAANAQQAAVTSLYHTALGRTADSAGLQFWFDAAAHGQSLLQIATAITNNPEFQAEAALSSSDFVQFLYQNTFGRVADAGGLAYWTHQLDSGVTRGQLIAAFADVAGQTINGTSHTEATVIGHVSIIQNIV